MNLQLIEWYFDIVFAQFFINTLIHGSKNYPIIGGFYPNVKLQIDGTGS